MEAVFTILKYLVIGFFGFLAFLFLLALIFGKRVLKKWEYEANFYNKKGREIGEFDIEMQKYAKEEGDYQLKAKFVLRHSKLGKGQIVQVHLDDILVMEGTVEHEGRIYLNNQHLKADINDPEEGQICRVLSSGMELFSEPIKDDRFH